MSDPLPFLANIILTVHDTDAGLAFYRRLGVTMPNGPAAALAR